MNRKQRKQFREQHIAIATKYENKYVGKLAKLIRKQISSFKSQVRRDGLQRAVSTLQHNVYDPAVSVLLQKMYLDATPAFGLFQYRNAIMLSKVVKKESAAFGFSESWNFSIIDFLSQHLLERAVIPVTDTTRKLIMEVLDQGQQQGWGVERILTELGKVDQMSAYRARRIIRTELGIAANFGTNLAAAEVDFETVEEWITNIDGRERPSHKEMDGQVITTGEKFMVKVYKGRKPTGAVDQMTGPGDPSASPGNIINCRCTRAILPKRDANDELIVKPKVNLSTITNKRTYV